MGVSAEKFGCQFVDRASRCCRVKAVGDAISASVQTVDDLSTVKPT
jgi:hypothetical protein